MLEILQYSFFQKALISGILISIISWILWVFIILRKEANITHSISNFLFLGIATSLFFAGNYYIFGIFFAILASFLIFFIENSKIITNESIKEIIWQTWLASGIFIISFLGNMTLDINNLLFWNILFTNFLDIILVLILLFCWIILFFFFWKNFLKITISKDLALSSVKNIKFYELWFLIFLSIFIAISVKIFWILLISAFLVIPANISKILARSLKNIFLFSIFFSIFAVIIWLFSSYFLKTSAWSTIVLILIIIFIFSLILKRKS